jgi:hypothetical protein
VAGGWVFMFACEYKHYFHLFHYGHALSRIMTGQAWNGSIPMRLAIPSLMAKAAAAAIGRTHAIGMNTVSFPHRDFSR